jgi:hypothetical protein
MTDSRAEISKAFIQMGDIGLGDVDIEKYAKAAENYVCDVDLLVSEVFNCAQRGENEKFLRYWAETKLNNCNKSYDKLLSEFSAVNSEQRSLPSNGHKINFQRCYNFNLISTVLNNNFDFNILTLQFEYLITSK